jgi:Holliday junction resolvase-like predicted endonuclease
MIDEEKVRRVYTGAGSWLAGHPELDGLDVVFEAAAVRGRHVERVPLA